MPTRTKRHPRRPRSHKPAQRLMGQRRKRQPKVKREAYIGFQAPGQDYSEAGRPTAPPRWRIA